MGAGSLSAVAAGPAADAVAAKKKKGCKKGKKKAKKGTASAAKKKKGCKKGRKKGAKGTPKTPPPPKASGPQIPAGDYVCSYATYPYGTAYAGTVHILAGNRYMVNEGPATGTYVYYPDTGIMQFPSGDYSSFYGAYVADSKGFDVYSAVNDGVLEVGDYGWTCNLDTP
jgi:hypothetical protein